MAVFLTIISHVMISLGSKESILIANMLTASKVFFVLIIIVFGVFYITPSNWSGFFAFGAIGVYKASSITLLGYGGFDSITSVAEESINVKKDMTRAVFFDTLTCGILYIGVSLVITGITRIDETYRDRATAEVFHRIGATYLSTIVYIGGLVGTLTVGYYSYLVGIRVSAAMGRDGLLPQIVSEMHPKTRVPVKGACVQCIIMIVIVFCMSLEELVEIVTLSFILTFMCMNACCLSLRF